MKVNALGELLNDINFNLSRRIFDPNENKLRSFRLDHNQERVDSLFLPVLYGTIICFYDIFQKNRYQ
jgi:hypothetical protein